MVGAQLEEVAYFAGDELLVVNIAMLFPLTTTRRLGTRDVSGYLNIKAYIERIASRTSYQRAMAKADPGITPFLELGRYDFIIPDTIAAANFDRRAIPPRPALKMRSRPLHSFSVPVLLRPLPPRIPLRKGLSQGNRIGRKESRGLEELNERIRKLA